MTDKPKVPLPENEHAARAYLELCRDTVLDQNRISKQHSTLASGIVTLASLLFVIQAGGVGVELAGSGGGLAGSGGGLLVLWGPLFFSSYLLYRIVLPAWQSVIMSDWPVQYDVEHAEAYARNTASGRKAAQTLVDIAEYYRAMIDCNRVTLAAERELLGFLIMRLVLLIAWVILALVIQGNPLMILN